MSVRPASAPAGERVGAPAAEPNGGRRSHQLARITGPLRAVRRDATLRGGLLYCLEVFVVVRVALGVVAVVAVALIPDLSSLAGSRTGLPAIPSPVSVPGWPAHAVTAGWHNVFTVWERFDGLWYLSIARHGYVPGNGSAAFYPLYPLLIRWFGVALGGHPYAAALVVSNVAFVGALAALYVLTRRELDEQSARRAVLYTAIFPSALFFLAPYSESLFLLLVVLAFLFARRGRWFVAGVAGMLAALTRNVGVLLVLPLAIEAVHQAIRSGSRRVPARALLASALPAVGASLYLLYWHHRSGDWLAPIHQQATWQRHLTNPLGTLRLASQDAYRFVGIYPGGYHALDWLIAAPVLIAAGYALVRFRPAYGAYAWASILVPLAYIFDGRPLMSFPRFALPIFPVAWAFARWTRNRPGAHEAVVVVSCLLLGVMTLLFATWYYVF